MSEITSASLFNRDCRVIENPLVRGWYIDIFNNWIF